MLKVLRFRLQGIGDWLSAADPGYIRIQLGLRAALATLTTLLVMLVISILLTGAPVPAVGLFGALMCFLAFLVINDPRPSDRRVTTLLAIFPIAVAITLASLLSMSYGSASLHFWLSSFSRAFMCVVTACARSNSRCLLLWAITTILIGVRPNMLVELLLSVGVGLACAFVFQFVNPSHRPNTFDAAGNRRFLSPGRGNNWRDRSWFEQ